MTALEKIIKVQRETGWDDEKIWLHWKFMAKHTSKEGCPDPCEWCRQPDHILYIVPGIFSFGMEWICTHCAVSKYHKQIDEEMSKFAHL